MRKLTRAGRHNPPRRSIADRLTPAAMRVYYGPNRGPDPYFSVGDYAWGCGRCAGRGGPDGGFADSLDQARRLADGHARTHWFSRAVYDKGR